ncbi:hypothetical protein C427_3543 [Paraglaciecola psychrophila 170]|uniref:Uncharacterized protein n=1 Tax=Paraglaciecola psychrophila 170 TaxID=1129794 RepID=K6YXJ8_9ALTE|nr:hypothetical protein C427_3543 [Paraglaciecola psychrophila 170]GAC37439.1 hypothetical protein GPSY_1810 [Paraglaciecola psychrophila 170]
MLYEQLFMLNYTQLNWYVYDHLVTNSLNQKALLDQFY